MENDLRILSQLESYLHTHRGRFTPSDFALATGLPLPEIQGALYTLLERYECKVDMDPETGQVVFAFRYPLRRRTAKSLREVLRSIAFTTWRIFVKIYKAAIGIILITYTVVFLLLLLFALSATGSDRRQRRSSDTTIDLGSIFRLLFYLFLEGSRSKRQIQWQKDQYGFRYPVFADHWKPKSKEKKKRFLQAVYDFVFGPEYPRYTPLEDAKEAAAFIYFNDGLLTTGHLVALTGKPYDTAELRFTEYLARFQGDPEISDDGIVIGHFPQLTAQAVQTPPSKEQIIPYPAEIDPPVVHNGNSVAQNVLIIVMNAFNLGMSWSIIHYSLAYFNLAASSIITIALGYFPFIVSVLYFVIPLLRIPYVLRKKRQREREILRKKLFRTIITASSDTLSEHELLQRTQLTPGEIPAAKALLPELLTALQGELTLQEDGTPVYHFSRLHRELRIGPALHLIIDR